MRHQLAGFAPHLLVVAALGTVGGSMRPRPDSIFGPVQAAVLPRWILSGAPVFDVGAGPDSLHELYKVAGAVRLTDGRVVVANGGTELRIYGPDARYLKTVGRAGGGPGEFRRIARLGRGAGDSLLVVDGETGRLTIRSSDGTVGRSMLARGWGLAIVDHDATGGFIAGPVPAGSAHAAPGVLRTTYAVQVITPQGAVAKTLATGLVQDSYVSGPPRIEMGPMPFAAPVSVAAGRDRIYVAATPAYHVAVFARDGSTRPPIERAGAPRRVTHDDLDAYITDHVARYKSQRTRDVIRQRVEQRPRAELVPEIASLLTDEADNLWVQDFAIATRAPTTWTVYSSNGRAVATVTLPARFTPQQIGSDWLLGIQLDADDVQHIVLYRLTK